MADFDELLKQMREHSGEEPVPTNLYDDLANEYQKIVDQRDGATVQLQERDASIAEYQSQVSRLKSENYDLSIAQPSKPTSEPETPIDTGIAGLFTRRH